MNKFYIHETQNGYIFDKRFFWLALLCICSIAFLIAYQYDFDFAPRPYMICEAEVCPNILMDPMTRAADSHGNNLKDLCRGEWCNKEYVTRGVYGTPPPELFNQFPLISILFILAAIGFNHLAHNKGKTFDLKFNVSDKFLKKVKDIMESKDDSEENGEDD